MPRRPLRTVLIALIALAVAVPVITYVVVPQFVRRTLVEPVPAAAAPSAPVASGGAGATPDGSVHLTGALKRVDAVHYGSGTVTITGSNADRLLRFEGVSIAGAPDMYVYLSDRNDGDPGRFVNLGKLKATDGSFNYSVPADVDLSMVRSVVVWCRAFSVTVTWAPIG